MRELAKNLGIPNPGKDVHVQRYEVGGMNAYISSGCCLA
jgi:hypothetical protein